MGGLGLGCKMQNDSTHLKVGETGFDTHPQPLRIERPCSLGNPHPLKLNTNPTMSSVNLVSPFLRTSLEHENHLSWAFLVALKYSPELQRFLRDLVSRHDSMAHLETGYGWEPAEVKTQTSKLSPSTIE